MVAQESDRKLFSGKSNCQLFSYTRLFLFKKESTAEDIHLEIFKYFFRIFRSLDKEKKRPLDLNKLKYLYEKIFIENEQNEGKPPYIINIVNSAKNLKSKGIFSASQKTPCDFCKSKECVNCRFPYQDDVYLYEFLEQLKNFTKSFKLMVV